MKFIYMKVDFSAMIKLGHEIEIGNIDDKKAC